MLYHYYYLRGREVGMLIADLQFDFRLILSCDDEITEEIRNRPIEECERIREDRINRQFDADDLYKDYTRTRARVPANIWPRGYYLRHKYQSKRFILKRIDWLMNNRPKLS